MLFLKLLALLVNPRLVSHLKLLLQGSSMLIFVTNFIWSYLHQFFIDSHDLNGYGKPLKRPFDIYQSCLKAINDGQDIRQINW